LTFSAYHYLHHGTPKGRERGRSGSSFSKLLRRKRTTAAWEVEEENGFVRISEEEDSGETSEDGYLHGRLVHA